MGKLVSMPSVCLWTLVAFINFIDTRVVKQLALRVVPGPRMGVTCKRWKSIYNEQMSKITMVSTEHDVLLRLYGSTLVWL